MQVIEQHEGTIDEAPGDLGEHEQNAKLAKQLFKEIKSLRDVPNQAKSEVSAEFSTVRVDGQPNESKAFARSQSAHRFQRNKPRHVCAHRGATALF